MDSPIWHDNPCAFLLCCCGCVPVIGLLKGLILVGPIILIVTIGNTITALIWLPHNVVMTYYTLAVSPAIGPNIRILGLLLLPIPLLMWVPSVLVVSLSGGLLVGFFGPFCYTYYKYCAGWDLVEEAIKVVRDFWRTNSTSYFDYLDELRRPSDDQPWDIQFVKIFIGIFMSIIGCFVVGVSVLLLAILKFIPAMFRVWYESVKVYCCESSSGDSLVWATCFPFWVCWMAAWPAFAVLGLAGCLITGFSVGAVSPTLHSLRVDSISAGFVHMMNLIVDFDEQTNKAIFNDRKSSCLEFLRCAETDSESERVTIHPLIPSTGYRHVSSYNPATAEDNWTVQRVWDNLFVQAELHLKELLQKQLITFDEVTGRSSEHLYPGLASIVYWAMIERSADRFIVPNALITQYLGPGPDSIVMAYWGLSDEDLELVLGDGFVMTDANRPRDMISTNQFWLPAIHHVKQVVACPEVTTNNVCSQYITSVLLSGDVREATVPHGLPAMLGKAALDCVRRSRAMGEKISSNPIYTRRFRFVLQNIPISAATQRSDISDMV
eukprot:gb/GEZN01006317.1/.p1 GENE.gb/GEZN01006317.1/~~gb/GEZN01006317.1/.p1  ORF type:complete len:550 (+),score=45.64 gb/GEZN01006317.1/:25-1674(+)